MNRPASDFAANDDPLPQGIEGFDPWSDPRRRAAARRRLMQWFDRHARDLPWRREPTEYHIWVSEIMLQQTQVATVVDYYRRFLAAFPTIAALAAAEESELLRLWEGLGYYRRARSMHAAAKRIVAEHGGVFPDDPQQTLALPGIGRYTAGAILSIASDKRLPILEGNTIRVFSRWIGLRDDVSRAPVLNRLWAFAETMLPQKGAGKFNQAAMELGALVCRPTAPQCDRCCVARWCVARREGLQSEIPLTTAKMNYTDRREFAFVVPVRRRDSFLLYRIPEGRRWAGLWDFPRWTEGDAETAEAAAELLSGRLGIEIRLRDSGPLADIRHAVTRYRITLEVHRAAAVAVSAPAVAAEGVVAVSADQLQRLPLSVTGRKIANLISGTPASQLGTA